MGITALSLVTERKEGLLDRSWVAGEFCLSAALLTHQHLSIYCSVAIYSLNSVIQMLYINIHNLYNSMGAVLGSLRSNWQGASGWFKA